MSKSSIIKNTIQVISLVIIVFSIFVVVIPVLNSFRDEIYNSKEKIISQIEKDLGLSIKYSEMSPVVSTIIIRGVKINTNKGDTYLNVDRLELDLNPIKIFSKKGMNFDFFQLISSLTLIDADSVFDINDLDFIINFMGDIDYGGVIPFPIQGKGINLTIRSQGFNMVLNNAKVKLRGALSKYRYSIDTRIKFFDTQLEEFGFYESDIIFKGTANNGFSYVDADIDFDEILTHIGVIKSQKVNFLYKNNFIEILRDDELLRFLFRFKPDNGDLYLNLDSKALKLDDLIKFNKDLKDLDDFGDAVFKGNFKGLYNINDQSFLYSSKGSLFLSNNKLPLPITLYFNLIGDTKEVSAYYLNAFTRKGSANFTGSFNFETMFPKGKLDINNFELAENINLNTSVDFNIVNSNYINLFFKDLKVQDIYLGDFPTLVHIDENEINLKLYKDDDGIFSLSSSYDRLNNYLTGDFVLEDFSLGKFREIRSIKSLFDYANPKKLRLNGSFETDFNSYSYNITDLKVSDNRTSILKSDIRGNNNKLYIDYIKADIQDFHLVGRLEGLISEDDFKMNVDCLLNDNKYNINGLLKEGEVQLKGNYGLDLKLQYNDSIYLVLKTEKIPFSYKGYSINPTIDFKGILFNNNDFIVTVRDFNTSISHKDFKFSPYISFIMDGNQNQLQLKNFTYKDNIADINGSIKVVRNSDNLISLFTNLIGKNGENYQLDCSYGLNNGFFSIDSSFDNVILERFYIDNISGLTSLELKGSGTFDDFDLKGELKTENILYNNSLLDLSMGFNANEKFLSLNNFTGKYGDSQIEVPLITYNYNEGSILGNIKASQKVDRKRFTLENVLDIKINPIEKLTDFSINNFSKINGSLNIKSLHSDKEVLFSNKVIRIFNNKSALQLISVDKNLKVTYFYESGLLYSNVEKPYFASFKAKGKIKDDKIDLLLNDLNIDARIAEVFIPFTPEGDLRIVNFNQLEVKGQLNLFGDIANPSMNGLLWTECDMGVVYVNEDINPFRMNLRIKDSKLTILPASIFVGNTGEIRVNGEIDFDSWVPKKMQINTTIEETRSIPVTYQYDIINVDTNIYTQELNVIWENFVTRILGGVSITDSEITTKAKQEILEQPKPESGGSLLVDMVVNIGKNNTLFYPNKQIPVVEATAEAGSEIKINYNSVNERFTVDGKISIRDGSVAYSGQPFILREGEIELKLSEENIDPRVYVVGSKTVIYNEQKYDVLLTYQGGLISGVEPTRSSEPALPDDEILSLLGIAVAEDLDELLEVTDLIGVGYFTEPAESAIKDALGIDYVNIDSKILSRFVKSFTGNNRNQDIPENITESSFDQEDESQYNIEKLLDDSSISFGEFITEDLFAKVTVGADYNEVKEELEPDVNLELNLTTPHFDLGFSLKPELEEDTFFSPELKLSLQWKWIPGENKEN